MISLCRQERKVIRLTISDCVRAALLKGGKVQRELAEDWGISSLSAMGVKFSRGSWTANDLANVAEFTGGVLNIRYPDGHEIVIHPESRPRLRGKFKNAEKPGEEENQLPEKQTEE